MSTTVVASYLEVVGTTPTYLGFPAPPLATFPNDDAVCHAVWPPTLNDRFVPQGLALLAGGSAYVSGYIETGGANANFCRIVQVDLATGAELDRRRIERSQCKHVGASPSTRKAVFGSRTRNISCCSTGASKTRPCRPSGSNASMDPF